MLDSSVSENSQQPTSAFSEEAVLDNVESAPARNRGVWPSHLLSATQHVPWAWQLTSLWSVSQSKAMITMTNAYFIGFCVGM